MNPNQRRLQNLIAYGQTSTAMQDAGATPLVQASFGDLQVLDDLQIIQHFGFSSSPPGGTNVVGLFGGGNKSKGLILGTISPALRRKMLLSGETVIHDAWGNEVHLSAAGVTIKHAVQVTIAAADVAITGNLAITGTITATGDITAGAGAAPVSVLGHEHTSRGTGAATSAPIAGS